MNHPQQRIDPRAEYTIAQVARVLKTHVSTVIRLILRGKLLARRAHRIYWVDGSDLARFLARPAPAARTLALTPVRHDPKPEPAA